MAYAAEVKNIVKKFPSVTAVDDVSFSVEEGEIFGFLGPNGAGKTTLIRILTCLMKPTSGQANIRGIDVVKHPSLVRRNIGVVSQALTSDLDLTAYENLNIYGKYFDVPKKERKQSIDYLLGKVDLKDRAKELVATYSGGMRRRLEIARGLIHKPYILFLDEPTIGLDPQSRRVIWELLQKIRKETGLTIFITTHYMDEADILCDRIGIIDYGKIVALDSPANLKRSIGGFDIIEVSLSNFTPAVMEKLKAMKFIREIAEKDEMLRISVDDAAKSMSVLIDEFKKMGTTILYLAIHEQSLEDVFIHYTGKTIREAEVQKVNFFIGAGAPRQMPGGRL
ncbi:MAG: ATP-binding cassette domain-containing protein [Candidatus Omnitrophica bacterium]|nr:ATP-binding cassette domain-containing protein [Candidatus Omnitrophota bacterium]